MTKRIRCDNLILFRYAGTIERHEQQTGGHPEVTRYVSWNKETDIPKILLLVQWWLVGDTRPGDVISLINWNFNDLHQSWNQLILYRPSVYHSLFSRSWLCKLWLRIIYYSSVWDPRSYYFLRKNEKFVYKKKYYLQTPVGSRDSIHRAELVIVYQQVWVGNQGFTTDNQ